MSQNSKKLSDANRLLIDTKRSERSERNSYNKNLILFWELLLFFIF